MSNRLPIDDIRKARQDLEKRIRIDVSQFEQDTGLRVNSIDLSRTQNIEAIVGKIADVTIHLEVPR